MEREPIKPQFFSLFVPPFEWFRSLISQRGMQLREEETSLSQYLTELALKDMQRRNVVEANLVSDYKKYAKQKARIKRTRLSDTNKKGTFCLYFSKREGMEWLETVLSADFIREKTGVKSRSLYLWSLFIQDNWRSLTAEQRESWKDYVKHPAAETKKNKKANPGVAA